MFALQSVEVDANEYKAWLLLSGQPVGADVV
jgi:hypothetical protein